MSSGRSSLWLCTTLALGIAAGGCGSTGSSPPRRAASTSKVSAATAALAAPAARLSILSPRPGTHTGSTLTVRVALAGATRAGVHQFRYVLDRRLTRSGGAQLTFHDLAPGRHRLEALSPGTGAPTAVTRFTVRAPAQVPSAPAIPLPTAPAAAVQPTVSAPPAPSTNPAPAPMPTESAPPPAGGTPQNGGGDGDADNSGGPSDGDGNR